jgi:hypothetical protein
MAVRKATLLLILALVMSGAEMSLGQRTREKTKLPPKEKLKIRVKEKSAPPPNERGKGTSKKKKPISLALNNSHRTPATKLVDLPQMSFLPLQQMSVNT